MPVSHAEPGTVPRHVAIVMDGNGRWANKRFMPRFFGHEQGMETLLRVIDAFAERGVEYLTVFAFSSENWKRPEDEVSGIMGLVLVGVSKYLRKLAAEGVRIRVVGDRSTVSPKLRAAWDEAERLTAGNTRIHLSVAFNYGGRDEIVQAIRRIVADGVTEDKIDEDLLNRYLYTGDLPDPDLVIRTSGELRLSNFLIWQAAYAEYYFTPTYWPDFDKEELRKAIIEYNRRKRRFGMTDEQIDTA